MPRMRHMPRVRCVRFVSNMSRVSRFIQPCSPISAKAIPAGDDWLHEVKFDGYRVQAHKAGRDVEIFSRNGHDFTARFQPIAIMLAELPARSAVLDGEIVASDAAGVPDFRALHRRKVGPGDVSLWLFDLLASMVGICARSRCTSARPDCAGWCTILIAPLCWPPNPSTTAKH